MRKPIARVVEAVAGVVYEWGVSLFRLADWLDDDSDDETDTTESELEAMWRGGESTTTSGHNVNVTYTVTNSEGVQ